MSSIETTRTESTTENHAVESADAQLTEWAAPAFAEQAACAEICAYVYTS